MHEGMASQLRARTESSPAPGDLARMLTLCEEAGEFVCDPAALARVGSDCIPAAATKAATSLTWPVESAQDQVDQCEAALRGFSLKPNWWQSKVEVWDWSSQGV